MERIAWEVPFGLQGRFSNPKEDEEQARKEQPQMRCEPKPWHAQLKQLGHWYDPALYTDDKCSLAYCESVWWAMKTLWEKKILCSDIRVSFLLLPSLPSALSWLQVEPVGSQTLV